MDEDILAIVATFLVVFVPVAGITARFALKPLIDSLIRIAEVRRSTERVELMEQRIALMEQELRGLHARMEEIGEQAEFYRQLGGPRQ